jgi:hypothetical protein
VGAGDYDGDGFLDLLAHGSRKTPLLLAHFMNGGEILDNVELGDLPSPWFVVSAGERSPTP